jgi:NADPH:quinone reductase-like Zn-dependent oxidoreductase
MSPHKMKAIRVHRYGGPEVLELEDIPIPAPDPDEVLVKVEAAGVGPWDALVRTGKSGVAQALPLTPGSDIAGVVDHVGANVSAFAAGDAVFGCTNTSFVNGYAGYARAKASMIAAAPTSINAVEAASVPVVAVTAWEMLFTHADLKSGETVLIQGASGNVGAYAVQLARIAGARVLTAADNGKADVVIDTVGGDVQRASFDKLKRGGRLISSVSPPDADLATRCGVRVAFFIVSVTTEGLERISKLIDAREISVNVGSVLPLAQARVAHQMLGGMLHPPGKIVLELQP